MNFGLWLRVRLSERLARAWPKPSAATCGAIHTARAPRAPARCEDGHGPPHHFAAEHIEHGGQVHESGPGRHVESFGPQMSEPAEPP